MTIRIAVISLLALVAVAQRAPAQGLTVSLFERYLETLRLEAGIPGLSVAVIQDGQTWDNGFGFQNLEDSVRATATTPYPITDLSQIVAAALLLERCFEAGRIDLADHVRQWAEQFPEPETTVRHLLAHTAPAAGFRYDSARYASLSTVITQCTNQTYPLLVISGLLNRLGMVDSVPSHDLSILTPLLPNSEINDYAPVLRRLAVPYRVDSNRRATRSEYRAPALDASTGIVSTARDLARLDAALTDGVLVTQETLEAAWRNQGPIPTGLGWFVQTYNGERVVWHFGMAEGAYSSLWLKVPRRGLTLILLANSDRLSSPYHLENGDVTASLFAKLFLSLFVR